jgi:glutathione S-transferase
MLEELGVPYEYHRVDVRNGGTRTPEFLAIRPGGKLPAIDDDGFRLSESVAITFYLADKYRRELLPACLDSGLRDRPVYQRAASGG